MAITDESNGMVMPVAPMYGGGYGNNGGFGGMGGDWAWIILLILLAGNGGWGFGGGFGGMGGFAADGAMLYPWMNQAEITTQGFQNSALSGQLNGIQSGVQGLSTQLCNCCGDIQMALSNGFAGVEQGANARQIANMQQAFAAQTAMSQGFNSVSTQLAQGFCDNRAATQDLKYTIATEACATRSAATANTQAILDKLCQLELDGYKRENDSLRSQLTDAKFAASQSAQTAQILAGQSAEIDGVYNRLKNCPVPSMPVYGNTPIFSCNNNPGCGCGCGA